MVILGYSTLFLFLIAFGNCQKLFDKDFEDRRPQVPGKPDEIQCANEGFLAKVILFAWPNPKPVPPGTTIQLKLYTRELTNVKFADKGEIVTTDGFYAEKETVVIAHGFLGNSETSWMIRMARAYLSYADVNVLLVDWGIYAQTKNYHDAAIHTKEAGKQVAALLNALYTKIQQLSSTPREFKPIHMIGFSLGSHVVGIAASTLRDTYRNSAWKVKRITGLDPAFPCFHTNENSLDDSDAEFVDIIHTNGDQHYGIKLGMVKPIGHVDFYVNGGQVQPGCSPVKIPWYLKYLNPLADALISIPVNIAEAICSHQMAPEYFIESLDIARLNGKPLKGTLWDAELCSAAYFTHTEACSSNCMPLGIKATKSNDRGIYFVPTATKKPFNKISPEDRTAIEEELERAAYRQA